MQEAPTTSGPPKGEPTFWSPLRPYRRQLLTAALLVVASVCVQVEIPRALQIGIDALRRGQSAGAIRAGGWIVGLVSVYVVLRVISSSRFAYAARRAEYDVRRALLDRLHLLGGDFYRRFPTGEIVSRLTPDLTSVRLTCIAGILQVVVAFA